MLYQAPTSNPNLCFGIAVEEKRDNGDYRFSALLRFFVHIMMVCDEGLNLDTLAN